MPLSWNEIRHNAVAFAQEWADESREDAERQTFWNEFFAVFGLKRRLVASFEEPVKNLAGHWSSIDLFWKGMLLSSCSGRYSSTSCGRFRAGEMHADWPGAISIGEQESIRDDFRFERLTTHLKTLQHGPSTVHQDFMLE